MSALIKRVNSAYVTPRTYINIANRLQKKPVAEGYSAKQLPNSIADKSCEFVKAVFAKDDARIKQFLDPSAKYIRSKDGSSFIRYVENGVHVEGYMATDKRLLTAKQKWYISEDDNTITSCVEVYIDGNKSPEVWYIHFRSVKSSWKIYMLENDI
jgi:hypothetical protein